MKNEHIITILNQDDANKKGRKGVVRPTKFGDYLGRRIRDKTPYLRVYDLGRYTNGNDVSFVYKSVPIPPPVINGAGGINITPNFATDFNHDLFLTDYNTWAAVFREITAELDDYCISISEFDTYDTDKGLSSSTGATGVNPIPTASNLHNQFFPTTWGGGSRSFKYTSTPNYTDPSVIFTLDKTCDLFLSPMFHTRSGAAYAEISGLRNYDAILDHRTPISRTVLGDLVWRGIWTKRLDHTLLTGSEISYFRDFVLSDYGVTLWRAYGVNPAIDDNPITELTADGNLPTYADHSPSEWIGVTPYLSFTPFVRNIGDCLGAIRKHLGGTNYEWYFIWTTTTWIIAAGDLVNIRI
jgi:hypothetical protein